MVGTTVLGVTLLRKGFRPRVTSWLLALQIPLAAGILQVTSMGSAALPLMFAFGIAGRRISREQTVAAGAAHVVESARTVPFLGSGE